MTNAASLTGLMCRILLLSSVAYQDTNQVTLEFSTPRFLAPPSFMFCFTSTNYNLTRGDINVLSLLEGGDIFNTNEELVSRPPFERSTFFRGTSDLDALEVSTVYEVLGTDGFYSQSYKLQRCARLGEGARGHGARVGIVPRESQGFAAFGQALPRASGDASAQARTPVSQTARTATQVGLLAVRLATDPARPPAWAAWAARMCRYDDLIRDQSGTPIRGVADFPPNPEDSEAGMYWQQYGNCFTLTGREDGVVIRRVWERAAAASEGRMCVCGGAMNVHVGLQEYAWSLEPRVPASHLCRKTNRRGARLCEGGRASTATSRRLTLSGTAHPLHRPMETRHTLPDDRGGAQPAPAAARGSAAAPSSTTTLATTCTARHAQRHSAAALRLRLVHPLTALAGTLAPHGVAAPPARAAAQPCLHARVQQCHAHHLGSAAHHQHRRVQTERRDGRESDVQCAGGQVRRGVPTQVCACVCVGVVGVESSFPGADVGGGVGGRLRVWGGCVWVRACLPQPSEMQHPVPPSPRVRTAEWTYGLVLARACLPAGEWVWAAPPPGIATPAASPCMPAGPRSSRSWGPCLTRARSRASTGWGRQPAPPPPCR